MEEKDFFVSKKAPNKNVNSPEYISWNNERLSMSMALSVLNVIINNRECDFGTDSKNWINRVQGASYYGANEDKYASFVRLVLRAKAQNPDIVNHPYLSFLGNIDKQNILMCGKKFEEFSKDTESYQYFDLNRYIDFLCVEGQNKDVLFRSGTLNNVDEKKAKAAKDAYNLLISNVNNYQLPDRTK